MNKEALFCDGTEAYVTPPEPEAGQLIEFWFRTAKNDVDKVYLEIGDDEVLLMEKMLTKNRFDYYTIKWKIGDETACYRFRICSGEQVCYYSRWGVTDEKKEYYDFKLVPGFSTPDWAKGAVMYQIYVDRFCNGDPSNDVESSEYCYINEHVNKVDDWNRYPRPMDVREFYGGDIQGVINKLDYLQDLGVEVIYCNPLFVSPSNHKYDTQDYDYIDPHVGKIVKDGGDVLPKGELSNRYASKYRIRTTEKENLEASNQLFIKLVEELHERGMKIIIDGVFNHCGSFNKWMDRELIYKYAEGYEKGAYLSADSPYVNYFRFTETGEESWPNNAHYKGWWDHNTLPKLNYEDSRELQKYILEVARKWVSPPYNVDGWRLDVAADLGRSNEFNHEFWREFRKVVKEAKPEALILAEHYGDPREWLQGDQWDSVMNYDAFMEPVTWYLTGMEKHSDEYRSDLFANADHFANSMRHHMANMLTPSLMTAMNQLSNHDHSRFLTRTNHVVGRLGKMPAEAANKGTDMAVMRAAIIMQMTWIGAPTLYYGDEAGVCGFTDPDSRRTYPWGNENTELINFYKEMIQIHKKYMSLKKGSIRMLKVDKELIAYGRFWGGEQIVVIVNMSNSLREVIVPVWPIEVREESRMGRLMYSYEDGYVSDLEEYIIKDGKVSLMMGRHSVIVMKNKKW